MTPEDVRWGITVLGGIIVGLLGFLGVRLHNKQEQHDRLLTEHAIELEKRMTRDQVEALVDKVEERVNEGLKIQTRVLIRALRPGSSSNDDDSN